MRYPAWITKEGSKTLAEFPDCPGCQTFADKGEDIAAAAREALEGWLETHLAFGDAPPRPAKRPRAPRGAKLLWSPVVPRLGAALMLRWARQDAGLSQAELAQRAGVSQQQIAKLESPDANPTLESLEKIAAALGRRVELALASEAS
jgi:ribosome-binding protein aMBF1 (putative translation factor)